MDIDICECGKEKRTIDEVCPVCLSLKPKKKVYEERMEELELLVDDLIKRVEQLEKDQIK